MKQYSILTLCAHARSTCHTSYTAHTHSGAPPPPAGQGMADTAQMLVSNPMFSAAAQQYGQNLASRGQAYIDQNVSQYLSTCIEDQRL